ncbi:MAG TPA: hypothetical protein VJ377_03995, partial [Dehalococcoidales bacterium]|nr:hypothetical protein [Dehalococcoidales bacterium]
VIKIEANTLRRLGIPFIKNSYIKAIVYKEFKDDLLEDVEGMIKALLKFLCCSSKFNITDECINNSFKGAGYEAVVEEFKKQLKEKTVQELFNEYADEKAGYANTILTKAGIIMTSL